MAYLSGLPRSQQAKAAQLNLDGLRLDMLGNSRRRRWRAATVATGGGNLSPRPGDGSRRCLADLSLRAGAASGWAAAAGGRSVPAAGAASTPIQLTYAYALYLSGSDRDRQALAQLNTLPAAVERQHARTGAAAENAGDDRAHAEGCGRPVTNRRRKPICAGNRRTRIDLLLADWALARGAAAALDDYQQMKRRGTRQSGCATGRDRSLCGAGDLDARQRLNRTAAARRFAQQPTAGCQRLECGRRYA